MLQASPREGATGSGGRLFLARDSESDRGGSTQELCRGASRPVGGPPSYDPAPLTSPGPPHETGRGCGNPKPGRGAGGRMGEQRAQRRVAPWPPAPHTCVQAGGPAAAQPTALPEPCPAQFPWAWDVPRKTVGPQLSQAGRAPTRGSHPKVYQHGGGWGGVRCRSHTGPCRTHALRTSSEPRLACVQRVCHSPPDRLRASNRHTY